MADNYRIFPWDLKYPIHAFNKLNQAAYPDANFVNHSVFSGTRKEMVPMEGGKEKFQRLEPSDKGEGTPRIGTGLVSELTGEPPQRLDIMTLNFPVEDSKNLTVDEQKRIANTINKIEKEHPDFKDADFDYSKFKTEMNTAIMDEFHTEVFKEQQRQEPFKVLGQIYREKGKDLRDFAKYTADYATLVGPGLDQEWGDIRILNDADADSRTGARVLNYEEKQRMKENYGGIYVPLSTDHWKALWYEMLPGLLDQNTWAVAGGLAAEGAYETIVKPKWLKAVKKPNMYQKRTLFGKKKGALESGEVFLRHGQGNKKTWAQTMSDKFWLSGEGPTSYHQRYKHTKIFGIGAGMAIGLHEIAEQGYRNMAGIARSKDDLPPHAAMFAGAAENSLYGMGGHFIGEFWRAGSPWMKRLILGDQWKVKKHLDLADKYNISPSIVALTDKMWVGKYPTVLGKFPFIGRPFRDYVAKAYPNIQKAQDEVFNMLSPNAHKLIISGNIAKLAKTNSQNIAKLSQGHYQSFLQQARNIKHDQLKRFIPTTNTKAHSKKVLEELDEMPSFFDYEGGKMSPKNDEMLNLIKGLRNLDDRMGIVEYVQMKKWLHSISAGGGLNRRSEELLNGVLINLERDIGKINKTYIEDFAKQVYRTNPELAEHVYRQKVRLPDGQMQIRELKGLSAVTAQLDDVYASGATASRLDGHALEKVKMPGKKAFEAYDLGKGSDMNEMIAKINHLPEDKFYDELYKVFLNPKVQSPMGIRQLRLRLGKGTEGAEGMKMLLRRRIKDAQDLAIKPAELQERVISKKMFGRGKSVGEELKIFDTNKFIEELGLNTPSGRASFQQMLIDSQPSKLIGRDKDLVKQALKKAKPIKDLKLGEIKPGMTYEQWFKDIDEMLEVIDKVNQVAVEDGSKFIQRRAVFSGAQAIGSGVFVGSQLGNNGILAPAVFALIARAFGDILTDPAKVRTWVKATTADNRTAIELFKEQAFTRSFAELLKSGLPGTPGSVFDELEGSITNIAKGIKKNDRLEGARYREIQEELRKIEKYFWETETPRQETDKEVKNYLKEKIPYDTDRHTQLSQVQRIPDSRPVLTEPFREGEDLKVRPKTTPMGEQRPFYPKTPETPPVLRGATGQSSIAPGTYSALFPQDTLGTGISQQRQMAQGPQRTSLMASGGIALATPAAQLSGKVFENQAAKNIMSTFYGTPLQQTVQNMLLTGTAKEGDPRPEGQVKLSTLYDPQGKWIGKGPEPTGVSAPAGQEAWFTPGEQIKAPHSASAISGMQWSDLVRHGYDPWSRRYPGAGTYKPGTIAYESFDPVSTSASAITQQDPSRYRVAGLKEGGILSTRSAKQMVA